MAKYICLNCGYEHEGLTAPGKCPICKSPSSEFKSSDDGCTKEEQDSESLSSTCCVDNDKEKVTQNYPQVIEKMPKATDNTSGNIELKEIDEESQIVSLIEKEGIQRASEWYQEKHNCSTAEANKAIKKISLRNKAYCSLDDEREIMKFGVATLQAVKWYKEKNGLGLKEAKDAVDLVIKKHSSKQKLQPSKEESLQQPITNEIPYEPQEGTGKSKKNSCLAILGGFLFLTILGGILSNNSEEKGQNTIVAENDSVEEVTEPVEFVEEIASEDPLVSFLNETLNHAITESPERAVRKYFSREFISLYNDVEEIDKKVLESDPIGFWDFDFWTGGQDGELESISVLEAQETGHNSATAIVQYLIKFGPYDESKMSTEFKLLFEDGEWKIDDFSNYKWRFQNYLQDALKEQVEETTDNILKSATNSPIMRASV